MIAMTVDVAVNTAAPAVGAVVEACKPENLIPLFGESVAGTVRENYMRLDSDRPNRLGGSRTHYYANAAQNTEWHAEGDDSVIVSTSAPGIRMAYFGGTINPGVNSSSYSFVSGKDASLGAVREIYAPGGDKTKMLTIPVTPESYGRRAADFPDLKVLFGRNGPYALARVEQKSMAHMGRLLEREFGGAFSTESPTESREILFLLVRSVEIEGDETILPSPEAISGNLRRDFASVVSTIRESVMAEITSNATESQILGSMQRAADRARNLSHFARN